MTLEIVDATAEFWQNWIAWNRDVFSAVEIDVNSICIGERLFIQAESKEMYSGRLLLSQIPSDFKCPTSNRGISWIVILKIRIGSVSVCV